MQISRHLLLACAATTLLSQTFVQAADNEAQIRARQALEEKLKQTAPPIEVTVTNAAPKSALVKAKPAAKPAPQVMTITPTTTNVATPPVMVPAYAPTPSVDPNADKLSDALHQKMRETAPAPVIEPAKPIVTVEKPVKPVQVAPPVVSTPVAPVITIPAPAPNYAPLPGDTAVTVTPTLPAQPMPVATPNAKTMEPLVILPPLSGPPSSLSAAKQQKLDALLQQYRLDQLTPQQYHEQRAKILSEP